MTNQTTDTANCGCTDFTVSRRRFLAAAAAGAAGGVAASIFGDAFREVAYGAVRGGNVLVVLSLRGGADGLSMVVPRGPDHDLLAGYRPGIVVPKASLIGGDTRFGLHPAFAPLLPMWQAGTFGAVHAIGLPTPNRSHFDAMESVEDADAGSSLRRGWINRMVGLDTLAFPETAVQLGSSLLPTSLVGSAPALGVHQVSDLQIADLGTGGVTRKESLRGIWSGDHTGLGNMVRSTLAATTRLGPLATTEIPMTGYPNGQLKAVLANTAALIKADVGTKVVTIDYGDWDMHSGLGGNDPALGWMHDQVAHLAGSLKAFFADLGAASSRVTVATMSEFGRRVEQNGDNGVDHGYGNAMLLFGAGVNGGTVHGQWPGLASLTEGDVSLGQDYRSVLWEVLASRFPEVSGDRAQIFPNFVPETVGSMT